MIRAPRALLVVVLALGCCCSLGWLNPVAAQVSFVTPSASDTSPRTGELPGVLERGMQLETQRRWGEALTLYEDALRSHPNEVSLEQRFSTARAH
ncbi:MAG TPA: hypothetical protein VG713_09825, partial [Pirellulales bacterium]|nr:hypothetical protein [Pirellulales bacterium]